MNELFRCIAVHEEWLERHIEGCGYARCDNPADRSDVSRAVFPTFARPGIELITEVRQKPAATRQS
jgi:hypothetical protein